MSAMRVGDSYPFEFTMDPSPATGYRFETGRFFDSGESPPTYVWATGVPPHPERVTAIRIDPSRPLKLVRRDEIVTSGNLFPIRGGEKWGDVVMPYAQYFALRQTG